MHAIRRGSSPLLSTNVRIEMEDKIKIAWAAGVLEGEGSFLTKTGTDYPLVSCEMTDKDVLEELQSIFGGSISKVRKRKIHWKDSWKLMLYGESARKCMISVRPYMKSRRAQKIDEILSSWYNRVVPIRAPSENSILAGRAYLKGEGSLREIGRRFGVSQETVRRNANSLS